jgi:hypothetical protein
MGLHNAKGIFTNKMNTERYTHFQQENLKETDHLGDLGIVGRRILKCILQKWGVCGQDSSDACFEVFTVVMFLGCDAV